MLPVPTPEKKETAAILTSHPHGFKSPEDLKAFIETTLDADKAEDIDTIDLRGQSSIADFMVVASGRSTRQVSALAQKLENHLRLRGMKDVRVEGADHGNWVVVDAGDVIVHLFRPEVRDYYGIEKMWGATPAATSSLGASL